MSITTLHNKYLCLIPITSKFSSFAKFSKNESYHYRPRNLLHTNKYHENRFRIHIQKIARLKVLILKTSCI